MSLLYNEKSVIKRNSSQLGWKKSNIRLVRGDVVVWHKVLCKGIRFFTQEIIPFWDVNRLHGWRPRSFLISLQKGCRIWRLRFQQRCFLSGQLVQAAFEELLENVFQKLCVAIFDHQRGTCRVIVPFYSIEEYFERQSIRVDTVHIQQQLQRVSKLRFLSHLFLF